jgi:hypothetical protein
MTFVEYVKVSLLGIALCIIVAFAFACFCACYHILCPKREPLAENENSEYESSTENNNNI